MDIMPSVCLGKVGWKKNLPFFCTCGDRAKDTEGVQCIGPRMEIGPITLDSMLQNRCADFLDLFFGVIFFCCQPVKYVIHVSRVLEPDQISHTQSMVAKRGLTNTAEF